MENQHGAVRQYMSTESHALKHDPEPKGYADSKRTKLFWEMGVGMEGPASTIPYQGHFEHC